MNSPIVEYYTAPDGIRTALHVVRDESPQALPVIAIHGVTRNARDFIDVVPDLMTGGRSVALMDVRGRGLSDFDSDPNNYNLMIYASDLIGCLDQLGWDKAVIIGTSMGGLTTMTLAALAPERIGGVLFNDIGPQLESESLEQIRQMLLTPRGPYQTWDEAMQATREFNQHAFPKERSDDFWMAFANRLCRTWDDGLIHFDYDPAIGEPYREPQEVPDLWPVFDLLPDVPLGLVRGEISPLISAQTAQKMADRREGLTVTEIPDVGHAPLLTEPQARSALHDLLGRAP